MRSAGTMTNPPGGVVQCGARAGRSSIPRHLDLRPDLYTQLEDLLHSVWVAEADWRLNDRIDLATRSAPLYRAAA
jgi:hypothetical protein